MNHLEEIAQALGGIKDPAEMGRFLSEILTDRECRDLGLRWELMRLLKAGTPQREIAARLGVSLCKITRGSRVLKQPGSVCRRLLET